MKILIASNNPGKCRELERLLSGLSVELLTPLDLPGAPTVVEDGETFRENAAKKARELARFSRLHTVADDSGLCVDALGSRPGVKSSRFAGPDPTTERLCRKLLREMAHLTEGRRKAHFHCHIAFADPGGEVLFTAHGSCDGVIADHMSGDHGFGYDPVFVYPPARKTFAEMLPEEKNRVSHRGRALREFRRKFREWIKAGRGEQGSGESVPGKPDDPGL